MYPHTTISYAERVVVVVVDVVISDGVSKHHIHQCEV